MKNENLRQRAFVLLSQLHGKKNFIPYDLKNEKSFIRHITTENTIEIHHKICQNTCHILIF